MADRYYGTTVRGLRDGVGMLVEGEYEYVGEFKAGLKHGYGKRIGPEGIHEGVWEKDVINGIGVEIQNSGQKIIGEWQQDQLHGTAQITDDDFTELSGFKNGEKDGQCIITYKGEEMARGHYKKSLKHGWWREYTSEGTFTGLYAKDIKSGYGTLNSQNFKYRGNWANGKKHGFGIHTQDQFKYEGDFKANKFEGVGRISERSTSGSIKYIGHFEDHLKAGIGKLDDHQGCYLGGFDKDLRAGLGYIRTSQDTSYLGYWINDLKEGLGILISGKKVVKAQWKNDKIDGYCFTIVPGQRQLFEVYKNGQFLDDADPDELDAFLESIEDKIPDRFIEFATSKISKIESDINKAVKRLKEMDEPAFDFRSLQQKYETVKTMMTNGTAKGKSDRAYLTSLLQKNKVNVKEVPEFKWEIPKDSKIDRPVLNEAFGEGYEETCSPRRQPPNPEIASPTRKRESPSKELINSQNKRRVKKSESPKKSSQVESSEIAKPKFKEDTAELHTVVNKKARVIPFDPEEEERQNSEKEQTFNVPEKKFKEDNEKGEPVRDLVTEKVQKAINEEKNVDRPENIIARKSIKLIGDSCPTCGKIDKFEKKKTQIEPEPYKEHTESMEEIVKRIEEERIQKELKNLRIVSLTSKVILPTIKEKPKVDVAPVEQPKLSISSEPLKPNLIISTLKPLLLKGIPKPEAPPTIPVHPGPAEPSPAPQPIPAPTTTEPSGPGKLSVKPAQPADQLSLNGPTKALSLSRPVSFEPYQKLMKLNMFNAIAGQVSKY